MTKDPETRTKELFYAISLSEKRYRQCLKKREQYQNTITTISSQLPEDQRVQLCAAVDYLQNIETLIAGYELSRILTKVLRWVFPMPLTEGQFERLWRHIPSNYETFLTQQRSSPTIKDGNADCT